MNVNTSKLPKRWKRYNCFKRKTPSNVEVKEVNFVDEKLKNIFFDATSNHKENDPVILIEEMGMFSLKFVSGYNVIERNDMYVVNRLTGEQICEADSHDCISLVMVLADKDCIISFIVKNNVEIYLIDNPGVMLKTDGMICFSDFYSIPNSKGSALLVTYETFGKTIEEKVLGMFMVTNDKLINIVSTEKCYKKIDYVLGHIVAYNGEKIAAIYDLSGECIGEDKIEFFEIGNKKVFITSNSVCFAGNRLVSFKKKITGYNVINKIKTNSNTVDIIEITVGEKKSVTYLFDCDGDFIGGPFSEVKYFEGLFNSDDIDYYHEKNVIIKATLANKSKAEIISVSRCPSKVFNHNYIDVASHLSMYTEVKVLPGNELSYLILSMDGDWRIYKVNKSIAPEICIASIE